MYEDFPEARLGFRLGAGGVLPFLNDGIRLKRHFESQRRSEAVQVCLEMEHESFAELAI